MTLFNQPTSQRNLSSEDKDKPVIEMTRRAAVAIDLVEASDSPRSGTV